MKSVLLHLLLSIKESQSCCCKSTHLILARIDMHRSNKLYSLCQLLHILFRVGNAACNKNGIYISRYNSGHRANILRNLIDKGICIKSSLLIACSNPLLNLKERVGAKIRDKAALAINELGDLLLCIFSAKAEIYKRERRYSAGTLR